MITIGWLGGTKNNSIVMNSVSGEKHWMASTWAKSKLKDQNAESSNGVSYAVFAPLNEYLATLPEDIILQLDEVYEQSFMLLNESADLNVSALNGLLFTYIETIFKLVNYDNFEDWCFKFGNLNFKVGEKNKLNDNESAEITYLTEDYRNLLIFSVYIKLVMPILGMYHSIKKKELGDGRVLLSILEILQNDLFLDNKTVIRLNEYVEILTSKRVSNIDFVLTTNISINELVNYCIITVIWKKLLIFDARSQVSIIETVFNGLTDVFKRMSNCGPGEKLEKGGGEDKKEQPSIGDTYKIVDRVSPAVPAIIEAVINKDKIILSLNSKIKNNNPHFTIDQVQKMISYIDGITIRESHMTICSAVMRGVLNINDSQFVKYVDFKRLIAVCACGLLKMNLPALADFITCIPRERNISLLIGGGKPQLPIEPYLIELAHSQYSLVGNIEDLVNKKDSLIKELICHEWDFQYGHIENFGNEFFKLVLKVY